MWGLTRLWRSRRRFGTIGDEQSSQLTVASSGTRTVAGNQRLTADFYGFEGTARSDYLCGGDSNHDGADRIARQKFGACRWRSRRRGREVAGAGGAGRI